MRATRLNYRHVIVAFLCLLSVNAKVYCQIFPVEEGTLNYIISNFSVPDKKGLKGTVFTIAQGKYTNQGDFINHVIITKGSNTNQAIIRLPAFGTEYTWQATYKDGNKTSLFHFSIDTSRFVDTMQYRLRVLDNKNADSTLYIFLDYSRVLYDINGKPVWFLPDIPGAVNSQSRIRDLKPTLFNTITFLTDSGAYEINYNGKVLWEAPKLAGGKENYHHEFTRLSNGNYMVMGNEKVLRKLQGDSVLFSGDPSIVKRGNEYYKEIDFGTLIEYDRTGKMIWSWHAADYVQNHDFFSTTGREAFSTSTHMNGFYFDENRKNIYVSFKDLNRIVKLKYPGNKILAEYGDGRTAKGNRMFTGQHSCKLDRKNNLYLFDNNVGPGKVDPVSVVLILKEPQKASDSLEKIWEFKCDIDREARAAGSRGGSVTELENGNILVCMGMAPRIFIVNRNSHVLFNSISEEKVNDVWREYAQYRAAAITYLDLEKIIKQ